MIKNRPRGTSNLYLIVISCLAVLVIGGEIISQVPGQLGNNSLIKAYPWLYHRADDVPLKGEYIDLLAVGDILLGRGIAEKDDPFAEVSGLLRSSDIVIGNLECAITSANPSSDNLMDPARLEPILLIAPPRAADLLYQAGFNLVNLANNHALDAGVSGLAETAAFLEQAGITWVGAGQGNQAYAPQIIEVQGLHLAFLGYNAVPVPETKQVSDVSDLPQPEAFWGIAQRDVESFLDAVRKTSVQAEVVIVSIHWGYEYETKVDPAQRNLAERILEAGADVILGHHPHVAQPVEIVELPGRTAVVAYSLGNFLFDQGFGSTRQGLALRIVLDQKGLKGVQSIRVEAGLQPRFKEYSNNGAVASGDKKIVTFTCSHDTCQQIDQIDSLDIEESHSGEADLDGDGVPERYLLEGGEVIVLRGEMEAWRSPDTWRVVDVTHGDPDWDGREDLVLAFWRPDENGVLRSHPFIMGYRQGVFRTLWGGSAVSDPILELEVGDADGDGKDELIILEQRPDGIQRAVLVWRWHGWGFSQFWRSVEGDYEQLQYLPSEKGNPARIFVFDSH